MDTDTDSTAAESAPASVETKVPRPTILSNIDIILLALLKKQPSDFDMFLVARPAADWKTITVGSAAGNQTFPIPDDMSLDAIRVMSKDLTSLSAPMKSRLSLGASLRELEESWRSFTEDILAPPQKPAIHKVQSIISYPTTTFEFAHMMTDICSRLLAAAQDPTTRAMRSMHGNRTEFRTYFDDDSGAGCVSSSAVPKFADPRRADCIASLEAAHRISETKQETIYDEVTALRKIREASQIYDDLAQYPTQVLHIIGATSEQYLNCQHGPVTVMRLSWG